MSETSETFSLGWVVCPLEIENAESYGITRGYRLAQETTILHVWALLAGDSGKLIA